MTLAFSYVRFSSLKQQKGESFDRQSDFAAGVCKEHGWTLDESLTLHDLGVSAFRGKNAKVGALGLFLEVVKAGRVPEGSILIIESIDRLSRNKIGEALQLFTSILNSGVRIFTREPQRLYTPDSINDFATLIEPLIYMSRAHEESATKSFRLKDSWTRRRKRAEESGKPMTSNCPRWVEVVDGRFQLIAERAEIVKAIFKMSREGLGANRILKQLVADPVKYPAFGDSGAWRDSYVTQILQNRAAFGEFQPCVRSEDGKPVEDGEAIPNYYPAVVTETEWYVVQSAMKSRFRHYGRPGKDETNLFTGIVFDVEGNSMAVHTFRIVVNKKR